MLMDDLSTMLTIAMKWFNILVDEGRNILGM